ncbi:hypothetical protein [Candidatus Villigracilis saccharophilus]|uniref:hypothetical protein n=1 Tax=Candidatus Villigracilis saccharophilus TaxID=3140684 RepID=UPI003135829D|nr:hypothetical protein [Anaerolineales bacterium]
MLILISCSILFISALALIVLRVTQQNSRYAWWTAMGGATLTTISIFIWQTQMPFRLNLLAWQPDKLFVNPISFHADGISWPLALSIVTLTLTSMLTSVARPGVSNSLSWAGSLALGGLGLMAVTSDNPLTLVLVWGALDITELITQITSADSAADNEKIVISFSTRALGISLLLWAHIVSISQGGSFDFQSIAPISGLYLVAAAGLRLGVLPLHLPYSSESILRRGLGTSLRLISAASSLVLLTHIPAVSLNSNLTPFLLGLAIMAALYGGWMWLRAPDELTGRPYWIIGLAALSVTSALSGNPLGAVAWGCALVLVGGGLFLASVQQLWLNRALLIGAWSLSSFPFSLTASAWLGNLGFFIPFVIAAQALICAGFLRHALRPSGRDTFESQPRWARAVYPAGILFLITVQILLGFFGWDGASQIGAWVQAIIVSVLTFGLAWATPRFRVLNPIRAHWVSSTTTSSPDSIYSNIWGVYRAIGRVSQSINSTIEGEGGIMWTLLFLIIFISLLTQGLP